MDNNTGYILFNRDGTQPETMIAAYRTDDGIQLVVKGRQTPLLILFSVVAADLMKNCDIPANILIGTIKLAEKLGTDVAKFMGALEKEAEENK